MLSAGADRRSTEILKALSQKDSDMFISLPYRVGLYVSMSDETGGNKAQEEELKILHNIIRQISEDFCKSEISQKMLVEAYKQRERVPEWSKNLERVPEECQRIDDLLVSYVELDTDILSVRDTLIDIALAVALAFRESEEGEKEEYAQPLQSPFEIFKNKILALFGKDKPMQIDERFYHPNISPSEREALITLSRAMGGF